MEWWGLWQSGEQGPTGTVIVIAANPPSVTNMYGDSPTVTFYLRFFSGENWRCQAVKTPDAALHQ